MKEIFVKYEHLQSQKGKLIMPNGETKNFAKLDISGSKLLLYDNLNSEYDYRLRETVSILFRDLKEKQP